MAILDKCKGKRKRLPKTKVITVDGVERTIYCEQGTRDPIYPKMKGQQTHDMKLTAHLSEEEVNQLED